MARNVNIVHEMINKMSWNIEDIDTKKVVSIAEKAGDLMAKGLVQEAGVAFDELGKMFNKKLLDMGKSSIDFTDMIKMPDDSTLEKMTSSFTSVIASNVSDGIIAGINDAISNNSNIKKLQQLRAEQADLSSRRTKLKQTANEREDRYSYYYERATSGGMNIHRVQAAKQEANIEVQAKKAYDEFMIAESQLLDMKEDAEGYTEALRHAADAAYEYLRVGKLLNSDKGALKKQIKNADIIKGYSDSSLIDVANTYFNNEDYAKHYRTFAKNVTLELDKIDVKIRDITKNIKELESTISEADIKLANSDQIQEVYSKHLNKSGTVDKRYANKIRKEYVEYTPGQSNKALNNAFKAYNESVKNNEDWEQQYIYMVRFVEEYDHYVAKRKEANGGKLNDMDRNTLHPYQGLYKQLQPMTNDAKNMLDELWNMIENTNNPKIHIEVEPEVTDPIDKPKEITGGKDKIKIPVEPKKDKKLADKDDEYTPGGILDGDFFKSLMGGNLSDDAKEKQLANEASVDAVKEELSAQEGITGEMQKQKKLMFLHIGNFDFDPKDFKNTDRLERGPVQVDQGYGVYGDGLFGISNIDDIDVLADLVNRRGSGDLAGSKESIFALDVSDYNLWINETEEEAMGLAHMLHKINKFILSQGGFEFEKPLSDSINVETMFNDAKTVFKDFNMSFDDFSEWINQNINLLKEKGLQPTGEFTNLDDETARSHMFATKFMQQMGYEGVYNRTGDIEIDGYQWGSVIYDPDFEKIKAEVEQQQAQFKYIRDLLKFLGHSDEEINDMIDEINAMWYESANPDGDYKEFAKQHGGLVARIGEEKDYGRVEEDVSDEDLKRREKVELFDRQLEALEKNVLTSQEADHNIEERERILAQMREEGLLTESLEEVHNNINQRLRERADLIREAESQYDDVDDVLTGSRIGAIDSEEQYRRDHIKPFDNVISQMQDSGLFSQEELDKFLSISDAMEARAKDIKAITSLGELDKLYDESQNIDDADKLNDILRQRQALIDDIDPSVQNDYQGEIEHHQKINAEIEEKIGLLQKAKEQSQVGVDVGQGTGDSSSAELEKLQQENEKLQRENEQLERNQEADRNYYYSLIDEEAERAETEKRARQAAEAESEKLREQLAKVQTSSGVTMGADGRSLGDIEGESTQLGELDNSLKAVIQSINLKNRAFYNEGEIVGQVVGKEINTLSHLETRVKGINEQLDKLFGTLRNVKTNAKTDIKVKVENVGSGKKSDAKTKDNTPKRNKSDLTHLKKMYQDLGVLYAHLDEENWESQSAVIEVLEKKIKRQQESLKLTRDEIAALEEEKKIAEEAEGIIIQGKRRQKAIDDAKKAEEKSIKEREKAQKKADTDAKKVEEQAWKKRVKDAQKSVGINRANSTINASDSIINNVIGVDGVSQDIEAKAQELANQVGALRDLRNQIDTQGTEVSDDERKKLNEQINSVNKLTEEMKELLSIHQKYNGDNAEDVNADVDSFKNLGLDEYEQQLTRVAEASVNGKMTNAKFNADTKELTGTVKTGANAFTTYSFAVDEVTGKLRKLNQGTKKTETFMEGVTRKTKELAQYALGSISIYDVWNQIRKGVTYIREIDSALTELKKVTDETDETYDRFLDTASKTASKVGSTIKDVVNSTADWARLGYSMEQAHELAASTSVLLNVSEFDNIDSATSALISTIQAFGYTADESMDVVDVMNIIGNNFAVSTDGLATALQDSASALMSANNSYQEASAMVAAANKVVQDPSKVGGGLRTISLRLRGTEVEGEDNDGLITSKSKLQNKVKSLSGVDILTDTGAYKSTYQILLEISKVWQDMNDLDQAALLEIIAGKNRSNIAAAILSNTKDLEEAYATAMEAEGSAYAENEKYLDSIEGKIKRFQNALQTAWNNELQSEWIKGFVDAGTVIVELIDKIGLLQTAILGVFAVASVKKKQSMNESFFSFFDDVKTRARAITYGKDSAKEKADTSATDAETEAIKRNTGAKIENANASQISGAAEDQDTQDTIENIGVTETDTNITKENTAANIKNAQSSRVAAQGEQADTNATNVNIGATVNDSNATKVNTATNTSEVVSGVAGAVGTAKTASNVAKTTKAMSGLSKVIGLVTTAGKGLLKVVGGFLKSNWIILVITLLPSVISWFKNLGTAEDRLAEKTAELEEEWSSLYSTISGHTKEFNSLKKSTDELIPKYAELAQGVNKFGENMSLTDAEYEEFLLLNNQLAEMFPELVVGYDENGNAMLSLAGDVDTLTKSIKALVEAKRLETAEEIADTMPDVMNNIRETSDLYEKEEKKLKKQVELYQSSFDTIKKAYSEEAKQEFKESYGEHWEEAWRSAAADTVSSNLPNLQALFGSPEEWSKMIKNYTLEDGVTIDWEAFINGPELQNVLNGTEKQINDYSNRIESTWRRLNQVMSQWMLTDFDYNTMDSGAQDVAQKLVSSFDFSSIDYGWYHGNDEEQAQDYVKDNIIKPLADAEPAVQEAIGSLFDLKELYSSGELNTQEYQTVLNEMLAKLKEAGIGDETINAIKVSLDVEDVETKIAELGKYFTAEEIGSLTSEELEFAYRIVQKEGSMSFEELEKKIEQMAFNEADMVSVWDFSDMIKDLDKAKDGMDDLIDAMGKLAEGTALTKGELAQLAFKYPELLEASNLFTDGSVQGQKNMLNSILDMTEQEYDAQIDAKIAELEATNKVLQQQLDVEAEKANMLLQIEEDVANGKIRTEAQLQEAINAYYNREGQNYVSLKNGELEVNEKALNNQLEQGADFGEKSAENVWNPYADLIVDANEEGYSGAADATNSFGRFLSSAVSNMGSSLKALGRYIKDVLDPTKDAGSLSSYFTEAFYEGVTSKKANASFKGGKATVDGKSLEEWTDIQTEYNKEFQVKLNDTIKKNLNVINNLKNLKGLDLDDIYAKDGKGGGGKDNTKDQESDYERFQRLYERKLANLEGQQTYLENEIDTLEALNKGVSTDYYEELIDKENQKLTLHIAQRDVLQELFKAQKTNIDASEERMKALSAKTSLTDAEEKELETLKKQVEEYDKLADSLWDVEHAIQESTKRAIEFGKAMHDAQIEAIDKISEAYDAMDTISDNRKENLELYKENLEINGKYASEGWYNEMIRLTEEDAARQEQEVNDLLWAIDQYRTMENPFEEGTDEYKAFEIDRDKNIVDLQDQAAQAKNDWRTAINEADQLREDMKDNFIEAWDNISEAFDSIGSFLQNQLDFIDAYEERLNTLNINVPDSVYEAKIDTQKDIISNLDKQLAEDNRLLNEYAAKYGKDDKRYVEKLKEISEKETQKYQEETKILEFEQQIFDNQIDRFNQVIDRINDATQRLQNISDLISDEDVATEDGEWTDEGLTRLGMAYQQMAYNKQAAEEYAEKMDEVSDKYKRNEITEKEYYETMKELSDGQWDAINGYEEMKDAIVDLNEARIDMIEEGLDKEIEAYSELIDLKKEELDAERDLYDFKKNIEKQTKDIAALERRIASMGGSTDAATIAERTKLEAELRNAKDELDGSYRDHAYDSMGNALDDELDAYTKNSEDYIKSLRESIKETDLLIETTYQKVLQNTDIILQTITTKSNEYGFYIDDYLTSPWKNAQTEALDLETSAITHIDNIYNKVNSVTSTMIANVTQPWKDGKRDLLSFSEEVPKQLDAILQTAQSNQTEILNTTTDFVGKMKGQIDLIPTYADSAAARMLATAKQNVIDINAEYAKIKYPDYGTEDVNPPKTNNDGNNGGNDTGGSGNTGGYVAKPPTTYITGQSVKNLQKVLNEWLGTNLTVDGVYGPATTEAVKRAQKTINDSRLQNLLTTTVDGKYGESTKRAMHRYFQESAKKLKNSGNGSSAIGQGVQKYEQWKQLLPERMYAKGTLGTSRDELAITDESWIGEEITLAAGKNGQLQYLKKGSAVMPADISANLVEWGKLNPNMMGIDSITDGINLMSNYINKPEIKVDVENFLKVGTVSRDTLPELEKLMDKKIDTFAKQLNASIRKFK